jgi:hypothetical protein
LAAFGIEGSSCAANVMRLHCVFKDRPRDARRASRDADSETARPPAESVSFRLEANPDGRNHADPTARPRRRRPTSALLSVYDEQHLITYLRLLDAERDGADWKEVARIVLHIDPTREPLGHGTLGKLIWPARDG